MERPQVNIIQHQEITTSERSVDINSYEAQELLKKYGITSVIDNTIKNDNSNKSFEEMIKDLEEEERKSNLHKKLCNKPATINDPRYSEVKYQNVDMGNGNNFGIKIEIHSDMNGIGRR